MCGIFGMFGQEDAAYFTYLGLYALQHRGEESAGIVSFDGKQIRKQRGMGLVNDVFNEEDLSSLKGKVCIGHTRYSTTGSSISANVQPFVARHRKYNIATAHNGNLINTVALKEILEAKGSLFQTSMDSEVIVHLLAQDSHKDYKQSVIDSLSHLKGAFSLVLILDNVLIGARDPYGFRPLCLGRVGDSYVLASETCAFDLIGAEYIRDISPGEIVFISDKGLESVKPFKKERQALCIFEYIYFARPDSNIFGENVYSIRKRLGRQLFREFPAEGDLVMPVPDSGNYAALGFSEESKIPFEMGLVRNHYVGRTFIQPSQLIRDFRVKVKLNPVKNIFKDKKVIIIEDSIVRGTTTKARVRALREAGAKEIHMRVSCPPLKFPCFYGIDFPTKKELIAANNTVEEIKDFLGLDSLEYLSCEGMLSVMDHPKENFCTACFRGDYPVKPDSGFSKEILENQS